MADELAGSLPDVNAVANQTPSAPITAPINAAEISLAQEVADMRKLLNELLSDKQQQQQRFDRGRSRSRSRGRINVGITNSTE